MNNKQDIGKYIRDKRNANGWTQEELAEKLDVSVKTVSTWERGESSIKHDNIEKLAEVLGVSAVEIYEAKDMPGLSKEEKERVDQILKDLKDRIDSVQEITIRIDDHTNKVEDRGLTSIELGFYAFGLAFAAFFLAWWAASPKTPVLTFICFVSIIIGLAFMLFGKRIVGKLRKRIREKRELPEE